MISMYIYINIYMHTDTYIHIYGASIHNFKLLNEQLVLSGSLLHKNTHLHAYKSIHIYSQCKYKYVVT